MMVFKSCFLLSLVLGLAFGASLEDGRVEEVVTESVTSTAGLRSVNVSSTPAPDYIIRYPTTPEPDPSDPTAPPPGISIVDDEIRPRMTDQKIITGDVDCACGRPLSRIVGGENATINELPWTVALMRKKADGSIRGPYCGGTLICDRYVVTASHCVDGFTADGIQVWLLEEDFTQEEENEGRPTEKIDVEEIKMHPEYDKRKIDNDIALLKLSKPVNIEKADYVPACVPSDNENTYEGEDATVAGWGATEMGGDVSPNLQKVVVPVLTNKQCNWRSLYLGKITDNMLCAGDLASGGKDSCQGDSGGPLVVERNNRFLIVGVVSFGYGCAQPLAPGVYARVGALAPFVIENTQDCQFCNR